MAVSFAMHAASIAHRAWVSSHRSAITPSAVARLRPLLGGFSLLLAGTVCAQGPTPPARDPISSSPALNTATSVPTTTSVPNVEAMAHSPTRVRRSRPLGGLKGEVASLLLAARDGGSFNMAALAVPSAGRRGPGRDAPGVGSSETWAQLHCEIDGGSLLRALTLNAAAGQEGITDRDAEADLGNDADSESTTEPKALDQPELPPELELEIYAYVLNEQGEVKAHLSESLRLSLLEVGEAMQESGLRYRGKLGPLPAGTYQVRLLVREPLSQRFALRLLPLHVPSAGESDPAQTLLLPATEGWVHARQSAAKVGSARSGLPSPPSLDGETVASEMEGGEAVRSGQERQDARQPTEAHWISALPVLRAGEQTEAVLRLDVSNPNSTKGNLQFLDGEGRTLAEASYGPAESGQSLPSSDLAIRFPVPELPSGTYGVRLQPARGPANPQPAASAATPTVPGMRQSVLVLHPQHQPAARGLSWPALSRMTLTTPRRQQPEQDSAEEGKAGRQRLQRVGRLARDYRGALELMAAGDEAQALSAVEALERRTFATGHSEAPSHLFEAEGATAARLAERDPESLVPLLALHLSLHGRYAAQRSFPLAGHSRRLLASLANLYARKAEGDQAAGLAAAFLTEIGAYLERVGLRLPAAGFLDQALALEPGQSRALLTLGRLEERSGYFEAATRPLRQLLEREPSHAEGTLRLALCLRRNGETQAALDLVQPLTGRRNLPPWLQVVAWQETVRLLQDLDREQESREALDLALSQFPGQPRLVLLRWQSEAQRGGAIQTADQLLERVATDPGPSPRYRYHRPPPPTAPERRLRQGALARLPHLDQALSQLGGKR